MDERGWFARAWAVEEMAAEGLETRIAHCNLAYNARRGTIRGMHWQDPPHEEVKLVRCTRGAVYDVVIDLRPGSPTRGRWLGVELTASNGRMLYVPTGFAHGYQTLEDDTETYYLMSEVYAPEAARGVRYDDRAFAIEWPETEARIVSERDMAWPDWSP